MQPHRWHNGRTPLQHQCCNHLFNSPWQLQPGQAPQAGRCNSSRNSSNNRSSACRGLGLGRRRRCGSPARQRSNSSRNSSSSSSRSNRCSASRCLHLQRRCRRRGNLGRCRRRFILPRHRRRGSQAQISHSASNRSIARHRLSSPTRLAGPHRRQSQPHQCPRLHPRLRASLRRHPVTLRGPSSQTVTTQSSQGSIVA